MNALRAYHEELIDIYGFAVEMDSALTLWNMRLNEIVNGQAATTPLSTMYFGKGDPNDPGTLAHHARTLAYLIKASERDGIYARQLRWSAIVRLFSIWEDRFRKEIAGECGLTKNDVQGDAHGDLRKFRNAIVHARGRLDEEPTLLRYFSVGDVIEFSADQIIDLFQRLTEEFNALGVRHYGFDPDLKLTVM